MMFKRFRYKPNYINTAMSPAAREAKKRVQAKIERGIYKYETCSCFCGHNDSVPLFEMDYFGNYHPFVICANCGIMRAGPRLTRDSYIDFYTHEYRTLYGDTDKDKEELWLHRLNQGQAVYDFIVRYLNLPEKAVVFDIGCEMGATAFLFHNGGYEAAGVDYGKEYIEFGRGKTSLTLEIGGTERLRELDKKADLVILNHVFEHFLDLESELKNIREIAKPDSFIFIAVPGTFWWVENMCAGDIMGLAQNAHIWQFSLTSLRYVMECCGFEFVHGNDEVKSIFKTGNVFRARKDAPTNEFEEVLNFLIKTEQRYLPRLYAKRFLQLTGAENVVKHIRARLCRTSF